MDSKYNLCHSTSKNMFINIHDIQQINKQAANDMQRIKLIIVY